MNNDVRIMVSQLVIVCVFVVLFLMGLYWKWLLEYPIIVGGLIGGIVATVWWLMGRWCKIW